MSLDCYFGYFLGLFGCFLVICVYFMVCLYGYMVLPTPSIYKNIYTKEAIVSHLRLDEVVDLVHNALYEARYYVLGVSLVL